MKQKDIVLIIIIAFISGVISIFASRALFSSSSTAIQTVEVVDAISSDFTQPEAKYFNAESINPTKNITISENKNEKPF